jgi:hypothetical protein
MKYTVKARHEITYPDGTFRGGPGYVIDTTNWWDREVLARQGSALQPARSRQVPVDGVDMSKLAPPVEEAGGAQPAPAKKKATKKKAAKKPGLLERLKKSVEGGDA